MSGRPLILKLTELPAHPAWALGNLLDVRAAGDFAEAHLARSANLPLPSGQTPACAEAQLREALPGFLLPPRHEPLVVLSTRAELSLAVCHHLARRGRTATAAAVVDAATLAAAAPSLPPGSVVCGAPAHQLWRPPAFLTSHVALLPGPDLGPAVDLGAGCGRAAVWLAGRGYCVTAVDRLPEALAFGRRLAALHGVVCDFLQGDLRDPQQVPAGPWAVALCLRFLHRPLLRRMPELLLPGGVVLVQACRRTRGGLGAGELPELLPQSALEIVVCAEDEDDEGNLVAGCVARRRPAFP